MRGLFVFTGLIALGMIFWAALGYVMSFRKTGRSSKGLIQPYETDLFGG